MTVKISSVKNSRINEGVPHLLHHPLLPRATLKGIAARIAESGHGSETAGEVEEVRAASSIGLVMPNSWPSAWSRL